MMPHFDSLKIYDCGKHCEKRRKCLYQAISPFVTMFSTLYGTYFFYLQSTLKMSSAICFNLDQSKNLSSGNGVIHSINLISRMYLFMRTIHPSGRLDPTNKTWVHSQIKLGSNYQNYGISASTTIRNDFH